MNIIGEPAWANFIRKKLDHIPNLTIVSLSPTNEFSARVKAIDEALARGERVIVHSFTGKADLLRHNPLNTILPRCEFVQGPGSVVSYIKANLNTSR